MQRRDHGEPVGEPEPVDELQHLLLVAEVEGGGGLVEQEHGGLLGQRPGEHDALPLAAGQVRRAVRAANADRSSRSSTDAGDLPVVAALPAEIGDVRRAAEQGVVEHGHVGRQRRGLRGVGDQPGPVPAA